MQISSCLVALAALISTSIAAPTISVRSSTLTTRGRAFQDTNELYTSLRPMPFFTPFEEIVRLHRKIIEPDLNQDFEYWRVDMTSEYWFKRAEFRDDRIDAFPQLEKVDSEIQALESEAAGALAIWKDTKQPPSDGSSKYPLELYLLWIMKRLSLLQTDIRPEVYKLMVDWSIDLHKKCKQEYTPYPAGLGAVLVQIQTVRNWHAPKTINCQQIRTVEYDEKVLALYQLLSKQQYFINLQRLCDAAGKRYKFDVANVEPDLKPSQTQSS